VKGGQSFLDKFNGLVFNRLYKLELLQFQGEEFLLTVKFEAEVRQFFPPFLQTEVNTLQFCQQVDLLTS
jgi:hypothetical protein